MMTAYRLGNRRKTESPGVVVQAKAFKRHFNLSVAFVPDSTEPTETKHSQSEKKGNLHMVIDCPGKCGKKIVAPADGKAYLCKQCYANLMNLLMAIIRPASEPNHQHLKLVAPVLTAQEVA